MQRVMVSFLRIEGQERSTEDLDVCRRDSVDKTTTLERSPKTKALGRKDWTLGTLIEKLATQRHRSLPQKKEAGQHVAKSVLICGAD